jgi:hypothetical protein
MYDSVGKNGLEKLIWQKLGGHMLDSEADGSD